VHSAVGAYGTVKDKEGNTKRAARVSMAPANSVASLLTAPSTTSPTIGRVSVACKDALIAFFQNRDNKVAFMKAVGWGDRNLVSPMSLPC
jgi:hypothetical protein